MMSNLMATRTGAVTATQTVTGSLDTFLLFTTLDIKSTGDYRDISQKDFDSVIQLIGLRSMPVILKKPQWVDGITKTLADAGAPSLSEAGYWFSMSFEHCGAHTESHLIDELHGIVLNSGVIDTKNHVNMEFRHVVDEE